jgi:hypothetical protein
MADQDFSFQIDCKLPLGKSLIDSSLYDYDDELDNMISVFSDLTRAFSDRGIIFILSINNVVYQTMEVEFSIFLESFCELVAFIQDQSINRYELDFYEQGINYTLMFEKVSNEYYSLQFTDRNIPGFVPVCMEGSLLGLQLMLLTFYTRFTFLANKVCPAISKTKLYTEWRDLTGPLLF